jgi:nucleotide-binding universal stress UspA family protein
VTSDAPRNGRRRIVVGYDGSESARQAVSYAAARAGHGGKVWVVHCYGPPPDWLGAPNYQRLLDDHQTRGKAILDALILEDGNALVEVDYDFELVDGKPAEAISKVAQVRDADEIVIGSRGFGRLRSALGSVSQEVLHLADRPVVVIPHNATPSGG